MFPDLRMNIEGLHIPLDPAALVEAFALRDLLDARIAVAVGEFEEAGLHEVDGAVTMPAWLRHRTKRDQTTASKLSLHGQKLRRLPVLREAYLDGTVTGGQVEIILAILRLRHLDRFAEHEAALVPLLAKLGIDDLRAAMLGWRAKADALDDPKPPTEHENEVHLAKTLDGRGELRGSVDADLHALLEAGFRVADSGDRELTLAERRADALATVFQHFLDHQQIHKGGRHRPHLNVVMTYEQWANHEFDAARYLDTGLPVSPAGLGVLLCDSAFHRLVTSGTSAILDYGRATRVWPPDVYNAIAARDQGCRWPGCDRPASWCDIHHVLEWDADEGPTNPENGCMLCRRHHRMLHAGRGYAAKLLPDGTFEVTYPDCHVESSRPRGTTTQPFW